MLGYNPVAELLGPHMLSTLPHAQQAALTSRRFFPSLISAPFKSGLHAALDFAIIASLAGGGRLVDAGREEAPGPDAACTASPREPSTPRVTSRRGTGTREETVREPAGASTMTPEAVPSANLTTEVAR